MEFPPCVTSPTIKEALAGFDSSFSGSSKNTRNTYIHSIKLFAEFLEDQLGWDLTTRCVADLSSGTTLQYLGWLNQPRTSAAIKTYSAALNRFLKYTGMQVSIPQKTLLSPAQPEITQEDDKLKTEACTVPADFGDVMLIAALAWPLPPLDAGRTNRRLARLEVLRARALVAILRSTALRIADACSLSREIYEYAKLNGGSFQFEMTATQTFAHCHLGADTIEIVDSYLAERQDDSPWLLIQHGRTITLATRLSAAGDKARGYGARLGPYGARDIIARVAQMAGYDLSNSGKNISTQGFRYWHIQQLKAAGLSIIEIQTVLGHAHAETTKNLLSTIGSEEKGHNQIVDERIKEAIDSAENRLQNIKRT